VIEVNPATMVASCTEVADAGNQTALINSLMFTGQNNLVGIFANDPTGVLINTSTGVSSALSPNEIMMPQAFGDGASQPFSLPRFVRGVLGDLIFYDGFESEFIFEDGFEGGIMPPTCPNF